jgi:hypothetical protein
MAISNISGSTFEARAIPDKVRLCFCLQLELINLARDAWICCSLEGYQKMRGKEGLRLIH